MSVLPLQPLQPLQTHSKPIVIEVGVVTVEKTQPLRPLLQPLLQPLQTDAVTVGLSSVTVEKTQPLQVNSLKTLSLSNLVTVVTVVTVKRGAILKLAFEFEAKIVDRWSDAK